LKVAFITHYTDLYGANQSLLNLIDGLKSYNVTPYVVAPFEGKMIDALKRRNVEFAIISIQWWVDGSKFESNSIKKLWQSALDFHAAVMRLYRNLKVLPSLSKQLRTWDVDAVYTNSSVTPAGALVSRKLNLPHIWHLREFVDLDYNFHHDWGKAVFKYLVSQADAKVAISRTIYSYFQKEISTDNFHVIYNGIASIAEFERFYEMANSSRNDNSPFTFALVGIIHPNKGQEIAIKALALLVNLFPNIRLLIVGGGDSASLKQLASELGILDNVEFWGYIDEPYKAYFTSDVVLMCSKNEGMGRVTVEAMSACRPVIGYDNAGTSEIIQHEQTGLLYKGEHEALALCMRRCIENPDWVKMLGKKAWLVARQEYNTEIYAEKIYQVLVSVVTRKNSFFWNKNRRCTQMNADKLGLSLGENCYK
jgi:glycosyltransferase involved in cell wall biosynthesis